MQRGDTGGERRQGYSELVSLITTTLDSLKARDSDIALNTERWKTVVETTSEIKEQLVTMNGRVRENEKGLAVAQSNPGSVTRDHCDERRSELEGKQEEKRGKLDERVQVLEGKVPATIQLLAVSFITGGVMAVVGFLLSKLP